MAELSDARINKTSLVLQYAFEHDVNFKERVIGIFGPITREKFDVVEIALTEMEAESRKAVTIKINSEGGDLAQGLAIIGRLKASKCRINIEGFGQVMSAAFLIFACGDHRKISRFTSSMFHELSYETSGRHSTNEDYVAQCATDYKNMCKWMAEFSKQDAKFWEKAGRRKDGYFSPEEMIALGVADEVI